MHLSTGGSGSCDATVRSARRTGDSIHLASPMARDKETDAGVIEIISPIRPFVHPRSVKRAGAANGAPGNWHTYNIHTQRMAASIANDY